VDGTSKLLGHGVLPLNRGQLYLCPDRTRATVKTITLVNVTDSDVVMNVYVNAGNPRRICGKDLKLRLGQYAQDLGEYSLEAGQALEGDASRTDAIEFTISGIEYHK
jgi:hypothetical protein